MKEIAEILKAVSSFGDNERAILATVIDVKGSGYRLPGARMLMLENGDTFGMVSGGCLEADVLERARKVLGSGEPEVFTYDTTDNEDSVFSLNMGCRGVIEIKLEPVGKDSPLIAEMCAAYVHREASENVEIPVAVLLYGAGADAVPFVARRSALGARDPRLERRTPNAEPRTSYAVNSITRSRVTCPCPQASPTSG